MSGNMRILLIGVGDRFRKLRKYVPSMIFFAMNIIIDARCGQSTAQSLATEACAYIRASPAFQRQGLDTRYSQEPRRTSQACQKVNCDSDLTPGVLKLFLFIDMQPL